MSYWTKRLEQIANKSYDDSVKVMKDLKRMYLQALDELEAAYEELYIRMLEDGEVSPLTQYKFNRYQKLEREFVEQLKKLGHEEVRMLEDLAISAYVAVATETSGVLNYVFDPLQLHQMAQKAFEMNWKGSNFSSRIWNNKSKLLVRLKKMVTDTIALGKSKDETIKDFMRVFNASFNDADRLVRTELMNIINQAQKDVYTSNGYTRYTLLPHYDTRTSEICKSLNTTKEYEFVKAITGENYPPLHPRCRTIAIPVIYDILSDKKWLNSTFQTEKKLNTHLKKHLHQYIGCDANGYIEVARVLLSEKLSDDVEGAVDNHGFIYKYRKSTNDFAVGHPGGSISTLFKPELGYEYWLKELKRIRG